MSTYISKLNKLRLNLIYLNVQDLLYLYFIKSIPI